jgi:GDP-mannose transporter
MIWTSFFALKNLGVPMATVLKNVTNLFTIGGDYLLYGKVYGAGVWASLALMCASALCGAVTDLAFDLEGYLWQLVNCLFTASYSLYLRGVMDKVVSLTVNKTRLDEFSMVFYNNLLSLPLIMMLMWWYGELDSVLYEPALQNPMFITAAIASALVAFGISFASLWFLSTTTATAYSLVGSLNKIPVAIIGLIAFDVPWNMENVASIMVGLFAGIVFVKAKATPVSK